MDQAPLLSVITVNWNNADGLEQTLRSLSEQDLSQCEIVVIDGGSTDRSVAVIEAFAGQLSHWVSEKDGGIYDAMNKGVKAARGKYVFFLNSGDALADNKVLGDFREAGFEADLITGNIFLQTARKVKAAPESLTFKYLFENALPHQGTFIKRSLFDSVGPYSTEYRIVSDWLHNCEALVFHKAQYRSWNRLVSFYDETGISSTKYTELYAERADVMQRFFPLFYNDYLMLENLEHQAAVKPVDKLRKNARSFVKKLIRKNG